MDKVFSMSKYANKEELYRNKAEYYERLVKFLDGKINAALKCNPAVASQLLREAQERDRFDD